MARCWGGAAVSLALTGCSLLLSNDLEGSAGQGASDLANDGGGPGSESGSAADGSDEWDGGSDATFAPQRRPVGPLIATTSASSITATVSGFFQIEFTSATTWKPTRLLDLGMPGNPNIAPALFEPLSAQIEGTTVGNSTDENYGCYEVENEAPARLAFTTWAHHVLPSGADAKAWARWTIYASGRLFVRTEIHNDGTDQLALPQGWIHSSFAFDPARPWNVVEGVDQRSATFFLEEPSGLGDTVVLHEPGDTMGSRSATERHWTGAARMLAPEHRIEKVSELQLGVTADEAAARVADARAPELGLLSGVERVGSGYERTSGAYVLSMSAMASVGTFELAPAQPRAYPAFEIRSLPASNGWRVALDGETVASSSTPVTPLGVAHYSPSASRLVFVYLGTISATASRERRTFTIERPL